MVARRAAMKAARNHDRTDQSPRRSNLTARRYRCCPSGSRAARLYGSWADQIKPRAPACNPVSIFRPSSCSPCWRQPVTPSRKPANSPANLRDRSSIRAMRCKTRGRMPETIRPSSRCSLENRGNLLLQLGDHGARRVMHQKLGVNAVALVEANIAGLVFVHHDLAVGFGRLQR